MDKLRLHSFSVMILPSLYKEPFKVSISLKDVDNASPLIVFQSKQKLLNNPVMTLLKSTVTTLSVTMPLNDAHHQQYLFDVTCILYVCIII